MQALFQDVLAARACLGPPTGVTYQAVSGDIFSWGLRVWRRVSLPRHIKRRSEPHQSLRSASTELPSLSSGPPIALI